MTITTYLFDVEIREDLRAFMVEAPPFVKILTVIMWLVSSYLGISVVSKYLYMLYHYHWLG